MDEEAKYKGWGFPVLFSQEDKKVDVAYDSDDIRQSFEILFTTKPGERIIAPEYGIDLKRFAFEPVNNDVINSIKFLIYEAVHNFEPRVILNEVEILHNDGIIGSTLNIKLYYTIKEFDEEESIELATTLG